LTFSAGAGFLQFLDSGGNSIAPSAAMLAAFALTGCETLNETFPGLASVTNPAPAAVETPADATAAAVVVAEEDTAPTVEDAIAYVEAAEAGRI